MGEGGGGARLEWGHTVRFFVWSDSAATAAASRIWVGLLAQWPHAYTQLHTNRQKDRLLAHINKSTQAYALVFFSSEPKRALQAVHHSSNGDCVEPGPFNGFAVPIDELAYLVFRTSAKTTPRAWNLQLPHMSIRCPGLFVQGVEKVQATQILSERRWGVGVGGEGLPLAPTSAPPPPCQPHDPKRGFPASPEVPIPSGEGAGYAGQSTMA